jgi:hypothetical protein
LRGAGEEEQTRFDDRRKGRRERDGGREMDI